MKYGFAVIQMDSVAVDDLSVLTVTYSQIFDLTSLLFGLWVGHCVT